jgi:hypothetical protein
VGHQQITLHESREHMAVVIPNYIPSRCRISQSRFLPFPAMALYVVSVTHAIV